MDNKYFKGDELASAICSIFGCCVSITFLVLICCFHSTTLGLITGIIFYSLLILYYIFGTLFHFFKKKSKAVFCIFDRILFYLVIVMMFFSVCLVNNGSKGILLFVLLSLLLLLYSFICDNREKISLIFLISSFLLLICCVLDLKNHFMFLSSIIVINLSFLLEQIGYRIKYFHFISHILFIIGIVIEFFYLLFYVI